MSVHAISLPHIWPPEALAGSALTWQKIPTDSVEETLAVGQALASLLTPGTTMPIYGNLGAGKTVLCRGIARGCGVDESVTSPTFNIVQEYRCSTGTWLFHLDMYRINDSVAAIAFGIDEYLFAPQAVSLIEWPERIEPLLYTAETLGTDTKAGTVIPVCLEYSGENRRIIHLPTATAVRLNMQGQGLI